MTALAGNLAFLVGGLGLLLTSKIRSLSMKNQDDPDMMKRTKSNVNEIDRIVRVLVREKFRSRATNRKMDIEEFVNR